MSTPKFCPSCGQPFLKEGTATVPFWGSDRMGYDCFCRLCKWSGDILPDDDTADVAELKAVK